VCARRASVVVEVAVALQVTERKDGNKRVLTLRQEKFTADGSADSMCSWSLTLLSVSTNVCYIVNSLDAVIQSLHFSTV